MSTGNWDQFKQVFEVLVLLEPHRRALLLDALDPAVRREVEPLLYPGAGVDITSAERTSGEWIGPYRIRQQIGEGGMGVVYEAVQETPVRRRVALKRIKSGMDTDEVIARFESERQALAMMSHPSVASVFDAGTTEQGQPYFVMELVRGVPITDYCDQNRLALVERLELFMDVCEAIEHAHQKGILHRDIKPSNVLVTTDDDKPAPKVIDFGMAKATAHPLSEPSARTEVGRTLGTPEYMSPEQADLSIDVDTRTDVYSLGVLLYELLAGARPFESSDRRPISVEELRRTIREVDPEKPSKRFAELDSEAVAAARNRRLNASEVTNRLRGDLDSVTLKAIEKDRERRYASAGELAADIARHLNDEPIRARPPSRTYRARKFIRRHRVLAVAGPGIVAALLTGGIVASWGLVQARRAEAGALADARRAEREALAASEVSSFMLDLFEPTGPDGTVEPTVQQMLARGAETLQSLGDQPLHQARLMDAVGVVYRTLGMYEESEALIASGLRIRQSNLGDDHQEVADSLYSLAALQRSRGKYERSETLHRRALAVREANAEQDGEAVAASANALAVVLALQARYDESEALFHRSLEIRESVFGQDSLAAIVTLANLANLYAIQGKNDEATPLFERILAIRERELGPENALVAESLHNLAYFYVRTERFHEAEPLFERSLSINRKLLGDEHPKIGQTIMGLGDVYGATGRGREGEVAFLEALSVFHGSVGKVHRLTADGYTKLAKLRATLGVPRAEADFQNAIAVWEELVGPEHPSTRDAQSAYALYLRDTGRDAGDAAAAKKNVPE